MNGPLRIGVRLPASGEVARSPRGVMGVARWAHELGYASVWASDHVILPLDVDSTYPGDPEGKWRLPPDTPWLDPLTTLAAVAMVAPGVELGTAVLVLPLRPPVLVAKQASTLSVLSGGRVVLGIGAGWMREEFDLVGASFPDRGARTEAAVRLLRALWAGEVVRAGGPAGLPRDAQMQPAPASDIPILWGGHSTATLRRVAVVGDGWLPIHRTIPDLERGIGELHAVCERHGRDPHTLRIVAKPGAGFRVEGPDVERLVGIGVDDLVIDPPLDPPDLRGCRAELERVAGLMGLTPREAAA